MVACLCTNTELCSANKKMAVRLIAWFCRVSSENATTTNKKDQQKKYIINERANKTNTLKRIFIIVAIDFFSSWVCVCTVSDNVKIEYVNKRLLKKSKISFFFLHFFLSMWLHLIKSFLLLGMGVSAGLGCGCRWMSIFFSSTPTPS